MVLPASLTSAFSYPLSMFGYGAPAEPKLTLGDWLAKSGKQPEELLRDGFSLKRATGDLLRDRSIPEP